MVHILGLEKSADMRPSSSLDMMVDGMADDDDRSGCDEEVENGFSRDKDRYDNNESNDDEDGDENGENSDGDNDDSDFDAAMARRGTKRPYLDGGEDDEDDEDDDDDDDSDDGDWVPVTWGCINCMAENPESRIQCQFCSAPRPSSPPEECSLLHITSSGASLRPVDGFGLTGLCYDARMLLHHAANDAGHVERPNRIRSIYEHLQAVGVVKKCGKIEAREATDVELSLVHSLQHIENVDITSTREATTINADTFANRYSAMCARLSAGSTVESVARVLKGQYRRAIAVVRPPGHHAGVCSCSGFCLYNNVGVAAKAAIAHYGARKVLILDWDVHHGNGTQSMFFNDDKVLYMSLHRGNDFFPGTGLMTDVGTGGGLGFNVNIPWATDAVGDAEYLAAFHHVIMPIATEYAPDIVLVSAGFDAAQGDPLGGCCVSPQGYAHMTALLLTLAQGRMVMVLEGGYNLRSISTSMEACARVMLGEGTPRLTLSTPMPTAIDVITQVQQTHSQYWNCLAAIAKSSQLGKRKKGEHSSESRSAEPAPKQPSIHSVAAAWFWGRRRG